MDPANIPLPRTPLVDEHSASAMDPIIAPAPAESSNDQSPSSIALPLNEKKMPGSARTDSVYSAGSDASEHSLFSRTGTSTSSQSGFRGSNSVPEETASEIFFADAHGTGEIRTQEVSFESSDSSGPLSPASLVAWDTFKSQIKAIGDPFMLFSFWFFQFLMQNYYKLRKFIIYVYNQICTSISVVHQYLKAKLDIAINYVYFWATSFGIAMVSGLCSAYTMLLECLCTMVDSACQSLTNAFNFAVFCVCRCAASVGSVVTSCHRFVRDTFFELWTLVAVGPLTRATQWIRMTPLSYFYLEAEPISGFPGLAIGFFFLFWAIPTIWVQEVGKDVLTFLRYAVSTVHVFASGVIPSIKQIPEFVRDFTSGPYETVAGCIRAALSNFPSRWQWISWISRLMRAVPLWLLLVAVAEHYDSPNASVLITPAVTFLTDAVRSSIIPAISKTALMIENAKDFAPSIFSYGEPLSHKFANLTVDVVSQLLPVVNKTFQWISAPIANAYAGAKAANSTIWPYMTGIYATMVDATSPVVPMATSLFAFISDGCMKVCRILASVFIDTAVDTEVDSGALTRTIGYAAAPVAAFTSAVFSTLPTSSSIGMPPVKVSEVSIGPMFQPHDQMQQLYPPATDSISYTFYYSLSSAVIDGLGDSINSTTMPARENISDAYHSYAMSLKEYGESISTLYGSIVKFEESTSLELGSMAGNLAQQGTPTVSHFSFKQTGVKDMFQQHLDSINAQSISVSAMAKKADSLYEKLNVKYLVLRDLRQEEVQKAKMTISAASLWCNIVYCSMREQARYDYGLLTVLDGPVHSEEGHEHVLQIHRLLAQLQSDVEVARKYHPPGIYEITEEWLKQIRIRAIELRLVSAAMDAVMKSEVNTWSRVGHARA